MVRTASPALWTNDNGRLTLAFHEGQARAWRSERRFTFVLAGTQSGKTSWGPWWLWREIRRCGAGDYLAVTASYDLFKLKLLPELRSVFQHTLGLGRYWSGDRVIELADPETGRFQAERADDPMWGRIILRSAAAGGGLESATAQAAWLDECGQDEFTVESWEAVLRRLSLSQGRVLGTTTPYNLGWVKSEIYDRWRAGNPDYAVVQFPSYANPAFSRAEYERARATMPGWRFAMFYDGEFARPAGLIYDCFRDDVHVIDDHPIPAEWPRTVGIDFGGANTALVWIAEDQARGRWVVYRESLSGGQSTAEHAAAAREHARRENVVAWLGGAKGETQQRMDWQAAGVPVLTPYVSDVEAGIMRPYGLFKQKRLFVFRSCAGLRDELGTYRRRLDESGQPTEEILEKRHFHRLDALRYAASGLELPPPAGTVPAAPPRDWFEADRNVSPW